MDVKLEESLPLLFQTILPLSVQQSEAAAYTESLEYSDSSLCLSLLFLFLT